MAGPIKIALVADASGVRKGMAETQQYIDAGVQQSVSSLQRVNDAFDFSSGTDAVSRTQQAFDAVDTGAMGFRDTITGIQDSMAGYAALTTTTEEATQRVTDAQAAYNAAVAQYGKDSAQAVTASTSLATAQEALGQQQGTLLDKLFLLGTGVGDAASGMVNFLLPAFALATPAITGARTAMAALNLTFLTNPVFLVIAAIVALVAVFVIAYQKSEMFRNIVNGAFNSVKNVVVGVWNWVKGNWPLLLSILTGPIGIAVRLITQNWDKIVSGVKSIPGKIKSVFADAGTFLTDAGKNIVSGIWRGIQSQAAWLKSTLTSWVQSTIPDPIRKALGIASPSKLMREIFTWVPKGAAAGIKDGTATVRTAAAGMATASVPRLQDTAGSRQLQTTRVTKAKLTVPAGSSNAAALLVELLRPEIRKRGGVSLVFS